MGRVNFHGRDSYWAGQNLAMGGWEGKHSRLQRYLDQRLRDGQAWEGSENSFAGVWPETRDGEEMSRSWNSSWKSGFKLYLLLSHPLLCSSVSFLSLPFTCFLSPQPKCPPSNPNPPSSHLTQTVQMEWMWDYHKTSTALEKEVRDQLSSPRGHSPLPQGERRHPKLWLGVWASLQHMWNL